MSTPSVKFINHREKHHSNHSGYDQIAYRIGIEVKTINTERRRSRIIPFRISNVLCRRSGLPWYGSNQFYKEVSAAVDMLKSHASVYHFLYGEQMYRYLGMMPRLHGHRVMATMHLPASRFIQAVPDPSHISHLDAVIVVGRNQIPIFEPLLGRDRVFWVPLGIDTEYFSPPRERFANYPPLCLFVGVHLRDFDTLCRTIRLVNKEDNRIQFVIVTFESEFHRFEGLENIVLRCGVPEPELRSLYQRADMMVQPMSDCTANTSTLEALACGLPVIASDIGGVRDYLDEACSVLVPPFNPEAMSEEILDLIGNRAKRHRLSERARHRAQAFRWERVIDDLEKVYAVVLRKSS